MKHLKHLKHTLATWALLGRMETPWRGDRRWCMDLAVRQRQEQLAGGRGVIRISSPSPAYWSIRRGGSPARWRQSWQEGSAVEVGEADWARWGMRRRGGSVEEAAGDGERRGREPVAARRSGVDGWAQRCREETVQRASGRAYGTSG
jgi:hypothetical protein